MGMLKCCDTPYSSKCWTRDLEVFSSWHWSPTWPYWGAWTLNLVLNSVSCLFLLPFTYWSVPPFSYLSVYHYLGHWRAGSRYYAWNLAVIYFVCVCVCKLQVAVQSDRSNLYEIQQWNKILPWRTALGASSCTDVQSWMCILGESFSECKTWPTFSEEYLAAMALEW